MDLIPSAYRQAHARVRRQRSAGLLAVALVAAVVAAHWGLSRLIAGEQAQQAKLAPELQRDRADQNLLRELGEQTRAVEAGLQERDRLKGQLPLQALPEVLIGVPGMLQWEQLRLAPAALAASGPVGHELILRGQAPDNDSLRQALAHWREVDGIQAVELLNARPRNPDSAVLNFELRLSLPAAASSASAAASGAAS